MIPAAGRNRTRQIDRSSSRLSGLPLLLGLQNKASTNFEKQNHLVIRAEMFVVNNLRLCISEQALYCGCLLRYNLSCLRCLDAELRDFFDTFELLARICPLRRIMGLSLHRRFHARVMLAGDVSW